MADVDVLFVGAGHNALVCAGYLAKAGLSVAMLERRHVVGGAVVTEEHIPGFRFDLGGSAHILIHHTPIVADLGLEDHGLEYIDLDPLFFHPFPDGRSLTIWRDLDRTCASIAAISPEDAERYRAFVNRWRPLGEAMVHAFNEAPTPANLVQSLGVRTRFGKKRDERLAELLRGYGQVLRQSFAGPELPATIGWMAAQSGPPPGEPLSAPFALWHPMYHVSGMKRPRGGSGMLTQALARMVAAHGGRIETSAPVKRILVEGGRAIGAETEDGREITARVVVAGCHVKTMARLVGEDHLPAKAKFLLDRARVGNGFGFVVRHAMSGLPEYVAGSGSGAGESDGVESVAGGSAVKPEHRALQFVCPDLAYLERAYGDYLGGRPSRDPALISMTFSAVDASLAPPGKHVMFLWGQYYPYELANGEQWDDVGEREADRMLEVLDRYAPGTSDKVIGRLVETPVYLERELGLRRGNVMHLDMSLDQMFLLRPALTMGGYRGPLKGLYLTGASTHPGGGIMGAAGRNAAGVVLGDWGKRR